MTQNLHVCAICFRPEVVYEVISGRNIKTLEGYLVVNLEVAISNSFRDMKKIISWRRRRRRRTANIDDSENAFAFRLKNDGRKIPRIETAEGSFALLVQLSSALAFPIVIVYLSIFSPILFYSE